MKDHNYLERVYVDRNTGHAGLNYGHRQFDGQRRHEHYSINPDSVLLDKKLSSYARNIYNFLAGRLRNGSASTACGTRWMANQLGFARSTVESGVLELAERKHITITVVGKKRRVYTLLSDVFSSPAGTPVSADAKTEGGSPKPTVLNCTRCKIPCRGLSSKTGYCRQCAADVRRDSRYAIARKEHPEWTALEVASYISNERMVKQVERKMRFEAKAAERMA